MRKALIGFFLGLLAINVAAQGPTPAQIQQALRAFVQTPNTWTALQTFSAGIAVSSCSGCGGGGGGAPTDATYITQIPNVTLTNEQALSALSTGLMRVATTTGVVTSVNTSAGLASNISDETGSGALVFATSPTLVTPALGTPSAINLANATNLPLGAVTGFGTGVATALAINIGSAGAPVLFNGALGTPSAGTLTNATGLPMTTGVTGILAGTNGGTGVNNSTRTMTYAGNVAYTGAFNPTFAIPSSSTWTFPSGGGTLSVATGTVTSIGTTSPITGGTITSTGTIACPTCGVTGSPLSQFAATTSAQLLATLTNPTGTGAAVFATSPTLVTPALGTPTALVLTNATGLPFQQVTGGTSTRVPYFNSSGALAQSGNHYWDNPNNQLNVHGGDNFPTNNNGALLVTRDAAGGSPVLATGMSVYRNSQAGAGTPTANDVVNAEYLLQATDNLWYAVGGVGGKITNVSPSTVGGGTNFYCKPNGAGDTTVPCMFISQAKKLRVGDDSDPTAYLEVKDGSGNVISLPTLASNTTFGIASSPLSQFAATTSAQLAGIITNETGSGALVFATSPTFVTPLLGTPTSVDLTNATNVPGGQITGLGTGVLTFLQTPSSANLATAVTDETGSGSLVFGTAPTITLGNGTGLPISTGVSGLASGIATWLATPSSANLLAAMSDKTGTGLLVFGTAPTFTTSITSPILYGGSGTANNLILRTTSGSGASGVIAFQTGTNGGTEMGRFTFGGALLIGTTNAAAKLVVSSDNAGANFLGDFYAGATSTPAQFIVRRARGSQASATATLNNDSIGSFSVRGYTSSSAFSTVDSGAFNFFATEDFTNTANGTSVQIRTTPNGSTTPITALQLGAVSGSMVITTVVTPASTGVRFLCISTAGVVSSQAAACSGT